MADRPYFSKKLSVEDFQKFYWYKTELVQICKDNQLPSYGTKAELNQYIIQYLSGIPQSQIKTVRTNTHISSLKTEQINPQTKLLATGFKLNAEARKFFADYFQMSKFSFKKSMAIKMRQVQSDQDTSATVQDLIDAYQNKTLTDNEEEHTYQWNNFVKDFNHDERSKKYSQKMKVAAIIWSKVRDGQTDKTYRSQLIDQYQSEIEKYRKN
ncbi:SAP domain-containing protein [Companilactobacillus paralimentarius]|uniref:SAP domain-containing protein n=1 Tax=Companilactobacillus paralimentarius TaxID=83526 RepID=UPI00384BF6D2